MSVIFGYDFYNNNNNSRQSEAALPDPRPVAC